MCSKHFSIKKLADVEALLPGFAKIWKEIKADTTTRQRAPKSITFTDRADPVFLHDHECGRRYALDLATMKLCGRLHVSGGEWAVHAGSNNDQAVRGLPGNAAVVSVAWNDYYRSFSVTVQVAKLPEAMAS
jgi:hypothetical protein